MSAQWLVTDGFGGSPGSTKYIVTMGLVPDGVEPAPAATFNNSTQNWLSPGLHICIPLALFLYLRMMP